MKIKGLGLSLIVFALFMAVPAIAQVPGQSPGQDPGMTSRIEPPFQAAEPYPPLGSDLIFDSGVVGEGEGVYYMGTLSDIDPERNELVMKTEVPGLLGPQLADVPFQTGADTTIGVCFRSIYNCESFFAAERGWEILSNIEEIGPIAEEDKRVLLIGNPDTNEVVHVQVLYGAEEEEMIG